MEEKSTYYDKKYSKTKNYWGIKPNKIIVNYINLFKENSKVLDLGCGEGRDSIFLSKKKFKLTSVDSSKVGLEKIKKENSEINLINSDIITYLNNLNEKFSVIIALNVLQFINVYNIKEVIKNIQNNTEINGINIITSFIAENNKQKENIIQNGRFLFNKNELKQFYSNNWEIINYEEFYGPWETHGEPLHRHYIVRLIAKKIK